MDDAPFRTAGDSDGDGEEETEEADEAGEGDGDGDAAAAAWLAVRVSAEGLLEPRCVIMATPETAAPLGHWFVLAAEGGESVGRRRSAASVSESESES